MPQDTPSRKLDQYIVRFPDGMRDQLKTEAANNNRSLNAEIVARLDDSLKQFSQKGASEFAQSLQALTRSELGEQIIQILSGATLANLGPEENEALTRVATDHHLGNRTEAPAFIIRRWLADNGYL